MSKQRRVRGPGWRVWLRDLGFIVLPWVVIFKQAGIGFDPPEQANVWLLLLMGAALGVPGAAQALSRSGGGAGTRSLQPPAPSERSESGRSSPIELSGGDA